MNLRKSNIIIPNNTKFFQPGITKLFNSFPSPYSYKAKVSKIESYETRLYYEYQNCCNYGGKTYFYTLTYNDKHIPRFEGQPCFDYLDLRSLLTGSFNKMLLRKYGCVLRYFISAELGDGKGVRGYKNNPHYHCLFFLYPPSAFPDKDFNDAGEYNQPDPKQFRSLVRRYWQGFDQDLDGYKSFKTKCKFGIVQEGLYDGLIQDFRGLFYCAKYVCKDSTLSAFENQLKVRLKLRFEQYRFSHKSLIDFMSEFPDYSNYLGVFQDSLFPGQLSEISFDMLEPWMKDDYNTFVQDRIDAMIDERVKLFRNRHSNKVRISNGVGDLALRFFDSNDLVKVPSKHGFEYKSMSLYYFRKKYTELRKDEESGKIFRVLNQDGIDLKVKNLQHNLQAVAENIQDKLNILLSNKELYDSFYVSPFNKTLFCGYEQFFTSKKHLLKTRPGELSQAAKDFAAYKMVYSFRWFRLQSDGSRNRVPPVVPIDDFWRFIKRPAMDYGCYSDNGCVNFLANPPEGWLPYSAHPYFHHYGSLFDSLDNFSDYLFTQKDDLSEQRAAERAKVRRFHVGNMVKSLTYRL